MITCEFCARRVRSAMLVAGLALLLPGCGGDWATVTGSLTLDGKPLAAGEDLQVTLMFNPASGSGATAAAAVDSEGQYSVTTGARSGIAPGSYVVTLSAMKVTFPNGPGAPPRRELVTPRRYTQARASDLKCEVQRGSNRCDFHLVSDGAAASG